ncbi:hypothetical protein [Capnocytophaga catalasegens]|uniref:Lipopolysaccharide biosynthesis protein n=1 Tax=Capnocytophaga catalasegens TaxID=1004260 RepID=A0AAV5AZU0_9FLAO|nr:hypothetical protein [Capnocytophaga catalasegens]GIZ14546.1 hypothetical protein RCZ03_05470 [Capnocytophaga catalasegens]GJM50748.1 hypothetical protein RCZ15_17210 [Capnocytophaga catalasegens]GJM51901.1 hypothetical protein RCZ16_02190 [Capnocytophaga catalasegens]
MTNKTIIFGAPIDFFNQKMVDNLKFLGFEVVDVSISLRYKYKSLKDRLINTFRKIILKDTSYKKKVRFALVEQQMNEKIDSLKEKADYVFIIRPDIYPEHFLRKLKTCSKTMIAYQWDGINVFPEVKKIVKYFDRFFVFDENDVKEGFLPITNFYFDIPEQLEIIENKNIFFVGVWKRNRIKPIEKLILQIEKTNYIADISLFTLNKNLLKKYKNSPINVTNKRISLDENHQKVCESAVLVDILNTVHNGLSFRVFEAMKYKKKLITNNLHIRNYDFYNENNILVLEKDADYERISSFLELPYIDLPQILYDKYAFTNWIKYILDISPYQPIELP